MRSAVLKYVVNWDGHLASWDEVGCTEVHGQLPGYDTLQQLGDERPV